MFEESLADRERLIVYTKRDLGYAGTPEDENVQQSSQMLSAEARSIAEL